MPSSVLRRVIDSTQPRFSNLRADSTQGPLEDADPPLADGRRHRVRGLVDDELGPRGQGDDGVRSRLNREDEVRVEVELLRPSESTQPDHRFRFTRSWSISSAVVIVRELASKPRCASIMLVNSEASSTFDISSVPEIVRPKMPPGVRSWALPEAALSIQFEPVGRRRPAPFWNRAMETYPAVTRSPPLSGM